MRESSLCQNLKIREVFSRDPLTSTIRMMALQRSSSLRRRATGKSSGTKMETFVCEGEYRQGLDHILSAFLTNISQPQQQAVWVSGFYGSGKSHLVRVLEHLWRDVEFPDGARARSVTTLPSDIDANLIELSRRVDRKAAYGRQRGPSPPEPAPSGWRFSQFYSRARGCRSSTLPHGWSCG